MKLTSGARDAEVMHIVGGGDAQEAWWYEEPHRITVHIRPRGTGPGGVLSVSIPREVLADYIRRTAS